MSGKITKSVLFAIGGIALALFAAFIYINNDLVPSSVKQRIETELGGKLPVVPKTPTTTGDVTSVESKDTTKADSDADLDNVFTAEEPADNFDDLVE